MSRIFSPAYVVLGSESGDKEHSVLFSNGSEYSFGTVELPTDSINLKKLPTVVPATCEAVD